MRCLYSRKWLPLMETWRKKRKQEWVALGQLKRLIEGGTRCLSPLDRPPLEAACSRGPAPHLVALSLNMDDQLKVDPCLEGHAKGPLLSPPPALLHRVADHDPALIEPRVEVEGDVAVLAQQIDAEPEMQRGDFGGSR